MDFFRCNQRINKQKNLKRLEWKLERNKFLTILHFRIYHYFFRNRD